MAAIPESFSGQFLSEHVASEAKRIQQRFATPAANILGSNNNLENEIAKLAGIFVYQMLQAMRQTVPKSELLKHDMSHSVYNAMFDQEVANNIAQQNGFGLTKLLMTQFQSDHKNIVSSVKRLDGLHSYQQSQQIYNPAFLDPIKGRLSSPYGWRIDPINQERQFHQGIDIAAPSGTIIQSAADGKVSFSGKQNGYGQLIIVDHIDGYQTYYAHNEANLVITEDIVDKGQPIAYVGNTGRVTGTHLHFEIRQNGQTVDPVSLISHVKNNIKFTSDSTDR